MVTTGGRYKQIGRNQRSHQTKLDTPHMMKVWNVSDIRRCTVRGAAELLIDAGWATLMRHGFLDKVPKDRSRTCMRGARHRFASATQKRKD